MLQISHVFATTGSDYSLALAGACTCPEKQTVREGEIMPWRDGKSVKDRFSGRKNGHAGRSVRECA